MSLNDQKVDSTVVICKHQSDILLSWRTCIALKIVSHDFPKQINVKKISIEDRETIKENLLSEYKNVFDDNNQLKIMKGSPMKIHLQLGTYAFCHLFCKASTFSLARGNERQSKED